MTPAIKEQTKTLKRKGPPKFQHLPAQRAKKLKRDWIEKKKIKSKWKAQKRKESSLGEASLPIGATEESPVGSDSTDGSSENDEMTTMAPTGETLLEVNNQPKFNSDNNTAKSNNSDRDKVPSSHRPSQRGRERREGARGGKSRQPNMRSKMGNLLAKIQKSQS